MSSYLTQADTVKDLIEQLQQWPGSSIVCDSDRWPPHPLDLFFTNASSIVVNAQKCELRGFASSFFYAAVVRWWWFVIVTAAPSFATATVRRLRIPGASISKLNVPFGFIVFAL